LKATCHQSKLSCGVPEVVVPKWVSALKKSFPIGNITFIMLEALSIIETTTSINSLSASSNVLSSPKHLFSTCASKMFRTNTDKSSSVVTASFSQSL
jgi:hypothetical protein